MSIRTIIKQTGIICVSVMALAVAGNSVAGDASAGKAKSGLCTGCHGTDGMSMSPMIPNLAGQKEAYLAKAIKDYKTGVRKDPMMSYMTGGLTDNEIDDLAAYFSGLK